MNSAQRAWSELLEARERGRQSEHSVFIHKGKGSEKGGKNSIVGKEREIRIDY